MKKYGAGKLWGGRFSGRTDREFFDFQKSLDYDFRLAEFDISHSLIHIAALRGAGLLNGREYAALEKALRRLLKRVRSEGPGFILREKGAAEDIHSYIHGQVEKEAGRAALKLHTFRSRNDQVAFDEKWYCLKECADIAGLMDALDGSLKKLSDRNRGVIFLGYTHARRAQAITFELYLDAFRSMFGRDRQRLGDYYGRLRVGIGAGALAGTSLGRDAYAKAVKAAVSGDRSKVVPAENSVDHVSDRDYIIELLSVLCIIQMHLSRLAEDLILYSGSEYFFLSLPEEFCTGSSLMPHKKNPDFLELVRGNTGRVYGGLIWVLTLMKGLPLSYNRDMQLDKEPLFSVVETMKNELSLLCRFLPGVKVNVGAVKAALSDRTFYATELAEWMVREKKVPFKKAHEAAGLLIKAAESSGEKIEDMKDAELRRLHPAFNAAVIKRVMDPFYAAGGGKRAPEKKSGGVKPAGLKPPAVEL